MKKLSANQPQIILVVELGGDHGAGGDLNQAATVWGRPFGLEGSVQHNHTLHSRKLWRQQAEPPTDTAPHAEGVQRQGLRVHGERLFDGAVNGEQGHEQRGGWSTCVGTCNYSMKNWHRVSSPLLRAKSPLFAESCRRILAGGCEHGRK